MTYAEAMRSYGSDKPDRRIPPMHPVEDLLPGAGRQRHCRWWRSTVPNTGAPSRKERDEFKAFGQERGLRVYDDVKRLERDFPAQMAQVRERAGAGENDLLLLAALGRRAQGPPPRGDRLPGLRPVAPATARRSSTTGTSCSTRRISSSSGWSISPCSSGTTKRTAGTPRTIPFTSVHDEDLEKLTTDPAHCRAKSYDLVLNGVELGSGSIRIHRRDVQTKVFARARLQR